MNADIFEIQAEINRGEYSFEQIATMYGITLHDVDQIFMEMIDLEREMEEYELYNSQESEWDYV